LKAPTFSPTQSGLGKSIKGFKDRVKGSDTAANDDHTAPAQIASKSAIDVEVKETHINKTSAESESLSD
jgi:Sec-independent protein translocase protein TatA